MTTRQTSAVWRRTGVAVACAATLGTALAVGPAVAGSAGIFRGNLESLSAAPSGLFDHATAQLVLVGHRDAATAVFVVHGVDQAAQGRTFGAHLHSGPCVRGDGAAAGPHYNHSGVVPPVANDQTEVWLDFTVDEGGNGQSVTQVPWVPQAGARSVVVHELPTAPNGTAGARLACLPVEW
jgi:Cu/Zn superoxide dismutase